MQNTVGNMVPALWLECMPFFFFFIVIERGERGERTQVTKGRCCERKTKKKKMFLPCLPVSRVWTLIVLIGDKKWVVETVGLSGRRGEGELPGMRRVLGGKCCLETEFNMKDA